MFEDTQQPEVPAEQKAVVIPFMKPRRMHDLKDYAQHGKNYYHDITNTSYGVHIHFFPSNTCVSEDILVMTNKLKEMTALLSADLSATFDVDANSLNRIQLELRTIGSSFSAEKLFKLLPVTSPTLECYNYKIHNVTSRSTRSQQANNMGYLGVKVLQMMGIYATRLTDLSIDSHLYYYKFSIKGDQTISEITNQHMQFDAYSNANMREAVFAMTNELRKAINDFYMVFIAKILFHAPRTYDYAKVDSAARETMEFIPNVKAYAKIEKTTTALGNEFNITKLRDRIFTECKIGRCFKAMMGSVINDQQVQWLVDMWQNSLPVMNDKNIFLHIATTPEEIEYAFTWAFEKTENLSTTTLKKSNPNSCMRYPLNLKNKLINHALSAGDNNFDSEVKSAKIHPSACFATKDFYVAYISNCDKPTDTSASTRLYARVVVGTQHPLSENFPSRLKAEYTNSKTVTHVMCPIYTISDYAYDLLMKRMYDMMESISADDQDWNHVLGSAITDMQHDNKMHSFRGSWEGLELKYIPARDNERFTKDMLMNSSIISGAINTSFRTIATYIDASTSHIIPIIKEDGSIALRFSSIHRDSSRTTNIISAKLTLTDELNEKLSASAIEVGFVEPDYSDVSMQASSFTSQHRGLQSVLFTLIGKCTCPNCKTKRPMTNTEFSKSVVDMIVSQTCSSGNCTAPSAPSASMWRDDLLSQIDPLMVSADYKTTEPLVNRISFSGYGNRRQNTSIELVKSIMSGEFTKKYPKLSTYIKSRVMSDFDHETGDPEDNLLVKSALNSGLYGISRDMVKVGNIFGNASNYAFLGEIADAGFSVCEGFRSARIHLGEPAPRHELGVTHFYSANSSKFRRVYKMVEYYPNDIRYNEVGTVSEAFLKSDYNKNLAGDGRAITYDQNARRWIIDTAKADMTMFSTFLYI